MSMRSVYSCWTCRGTGKVKVTYWVTHSTAATSIPDNLWTTCPDCDGYGKQIIKPPPTAIWTNEQEPTR